MKRRGASSGDRVEGVLDFMRLLWAVDHSLQRASKRMERTLGVTGPQRLVIRIVGRSPGISAGRLAGLLHLHPSTLTGILARLEKRRVIRREPDPSDRRRSLLSLIERGRRLDVEAEGTIEAAIQRALDRTVDSDLRAVRRVLERIASSLESGATNEKPASHLNPTSRRRPRRFQGGR